jgi:hypothetical protein
LASSTRVVPDNNPKENKVSRYSRAISDLLAGLVLITGTLTVFAARMASATPAANAQITVLYDAFGKVSGMQKDWAIRR